MWTRARRAAVALAALAAGLTAFVPSLVPDAEARPRKPYWMVSFLGGVLAPVRDTADEREIGLGVGVRVGYTTRVGLGLALSLEYSPLPVVEDQNGDGAATSVVTENHFVAGALVPRYTLGRDTFRLTIGAGGGGIMEQTRSRPAGDDGGPADTVSVFAPAAIGEVGIETHLWGSGGLLVTGSYLRSFGERESEVAALLGGLVFTFR